MRLWGVPVLRHNGLVLGRRVGNLSVDRGLLPLFFSCRGVEVVRRWREEMERGEIGDERRGTMEEGKGREGKAVAETLCASLGLCYPIGE